MKPVNDDIDKQWSIPPKFRASLDIDDEAAHALLLANDAEQKLLGKRINSPFSQKTPHDVQRSKALITIETLLKVQQFQKLEKSQIEQLAECYAMIGRYDLAAETTHEHKAFYKKMWNAVFLPDGNWCEHDKVKHQFIKENIFSFRDGRASTLLSCNVCHFFNVLDAPEHLTTRRSSASKHQGTTKGMTNAQMQTYHQNSVKKG